MANLRLKERQIRDLEVIRDFDPKSLDLAIERLSTLRPPPMKAAELVALFSQAADVSTTSAESVIRPVLWLHGLMREDDIAIDVLLNEVTAAIRENAIWEESDFNTWKVNEPSFRKLLAIDSFRIVTAALNLSYEYANLYQSGRILTDIRPIFSKDAKHIDGAVVSYSFCLRFDGMDGDHELNIAMDEDDVRTLMAQCDRAMIKARTARDLMLNKADVPTIISGESYDA